MGYFSKQETEQQNRDGGYGHGSYELSASQAERYAGMFAPRPMWHEGEGCSVNSCCCDPMEASQ